MTAKMNHSIISPGQEDKLPLYTYRCPVCSKLEDAYRPIAERHNGPLCHGPMSKVIAPTAIQPVLGGGNMPGYQCSVTGEFVTSRKRRKEIMREHNLYEKG